MLIAIVVRLRSLGEGMVPAQSGRANFAAVLDRLEAVDGALVRAVHDSPDAKPLTCSGLLGLGAGVDRVPVARGAQVTMRVTGLSAAMAAALHEAFVARPLHAWSLLGHRFAVDGITCDSSVDAWSGYTDYPQLLAEAVAVGERKPSIRLEFATPVAFRSAGLTVPLPLPGLVFGSLLDRWNRFSPVPLDQEVRAVAQAAVAVSQLRLESVPVPQKEKGLEIGSVGEMTYSYLGENAYWLHQLRVLAAYAVYSGVGLKTTMGMGQSCWRRW